MNCLIFSDEFLGFFRLSKSSKTINFQPLKETSVGCDDYSCRRIRQSTEKMKAMNLCFSMSTYPPGVVIWPSMYTKELEVCHSVIDPVRASVIVFIGVAANAGAIVLIWFGRRQEQVPGSGYNIPNVLVLVLCATDLTWLLCGECVWLASVLRGHWLGGPPSYLYSSFVSTTCLRLSGCVVILMGVERYLSLLKPFYYDNKVTIQRIFIVIFVLIVFSLLMSGFQLIGQLTTVTGECNSSSSSYCFTKDDAFVSWTSRVHTVYNFISVFESLVYIVVLVVCNVFVIRCMRQMRRRIEMVCPRSRDEYMKQVDMIKGVSAEFSRLMVGITLVFLITIIPYEVRICSCMYVCM